MEGPLIGTIVFFLLRGFLADLGPLVFDVAGERLRYSLPWTMPKGIAGWSAGRFDLGPFPASTSSSPPKSERVKI